MSYTWYEHLILIGRDSNISLEAILERLKAFYRKNDRQVQLNLEPNMLTLKIHNWELTLIRNEADHVLEESKEMAALYAQGSLFESAIAQCATRLEMAADADPDMNYFNDSIYVLEVLESFEDIYVFEPMDAIFLNISN